MQFMGRGRRLMRVAAVISSVGLVAAYVYHQSGGNVLSRWRDRLQPSEARILPGSKSKAVFVAREPTSTGVLVPASLPGSKSAVLFSADDGKALLPTPAPAEQSTVHASKPRRAVLPGSKSRPVFSSVPDSPPATPPTAAREVDPFAEPSGP
jgi:hypothetical protein